LEEMIHVFVVQVKNIKNVEWLMHVQRSPK
jgi:hypothetical protein